MSNKNTPMDEQLFKAEAFAKVPGAALGLQFKDITLTSKVGDFEPGTKFEYAILLGDVSALILIDENKVEHGFHLNISVGEKLDVDELKGGGEEHDESCDCGHDHD